MVLRERRSQRAYNRPTYEEAVAALAGPDYRE